MLDLNEIARILTAERTANGQLSEIARAVAFGAVAGGMSQRAVATAFGVSSTTINQTVNRFTATHSFKDSPGRGRPSNISRQDKQ